MVGPRLKIINGMFGAKLGGLEQVFVDYSEALAARGVDVANIVTPNAAVAAPLKALGQPVSAIANLNQYDVLAMARLRAAFKRERPHVIVAHGNRAIHLMRPAARGIAPFVAVNHSINIRRTIGSDFVIAINEDMRQRLTAAGQPANRIFKFFNMVRKPANLPAPSRMKAPPVIGAMGRFVPKKGFEVFIEALGRLKDAGAPFRAILAGSGELETALKAQATARGLDGYLSFPGWVSDKDAYFREIDIFAFTSFHDVCPVVLLEAFLWAKPTVLTDCPGPREISEDGVDSLRFPIDDAGALAQRIVKLTEDPGYALDLASAAQAKILAHHTFEQAGAQLEAILRTAAGLA